MKIKLLSLIFFSILFQAQSQDSAYYHTAFNASDDSLKMLLNTIIKGHTEFPYTSSSTDTWDILKETDRDPNDSNNVILIYSNTSVDAAQEYNNGSGWNREHVWAKSRGDFGTSQGPGTDVHHLRPCNISVNSSRNNRNFDNCITCIDIVTNSINTGSKRDANLWTFQPPENVKGDIARMIFYMAVRYEGAGSEPDLELTNILQTNTEKFPLHAVQTTLLEWNRLDSVDDFERNRNQVIYSYQGNKNPFIDYPEIAEYLWGDSIGAFWMAPEPDTAVVIGLYSASTFNFKVYPNPSRDGFVNLKSDVIPEQVMVYNQLGQLVLEERPYSNNYQLDLRNIETGVYTIKVNFNGVTQRQKLIIEH